MKKHNRILAILLSVLTLFSMLFSFSVTAYAAKINIKITKTDWDRAGADEYWNGGFLKSGYDFSLIHLMNTSEMLYCIEPGSPLNTGDHLFLNEYVNNITTPSIRDRIAVREVMGRIFQYVDYSQSGSPVSTEQGKALYIAAQLLVWELVEGERDEDFNYITPPAKYDKVLDSLAKSTNSTARKNMVMQYYNEIASKVKKHLVIPSFSRQSIGNAPVYEMNYWNGEYIIDLYDSNNVLSNYEFSCANSNVTFEKDGNRLTVISSSPLTETLNITVDKINSNRKGMICYGDGKGKDQDVVYVGDSIADPVRAFFKLKVPTGKILIEKTDKETGSVPQGSGDLTSAVFEIYSSDKSTVVDTLYCNGKSSVSSKELPSGLYYYKEKTPPTGYLIDNNFYPIEISGRTEIENNIAYGNIANTVKKAKVSIVKHNDSGDPIESPMENVGFKIWLKSAGSYDKAKPSERDVIHTDKNGFAETGLLPYGKYVCEEIRSEANEGYKLIDPFEIDINTNGETYCYILRNESYKAQLRIIKKDSETKQTIPLSCGFKIRDLKTGEFIKQKIFYPAVMEIDIFHTDSQTGIVNLPEALKYGKYEIVEISSSAPYLLNTETVKFEVTENEDKNVIEIEFFNEVAKGIISIEKKGNVIVGAEEVDGIYIPKYELQGLPGVKYTIIANEDIYSGGVLQYKKDEVIESIVTNEKGIAESSPHFLGSYRVVEAETIEPYVLDSTPHNVVLSYKDQYTAIVTESISLVNERQKIEIELEKEMELPEVIPEGWNPYKDVVFGVFAKIDIYDVNGNIAIPADGHVGFIQVDEDGKGVLVDELPLSEYYVKELQTNAIYELDNSVYEFIFEYSESENFVTVVQVNDGEPIVNKLKEAKICVYKTDGNTKKPLEGAIFGLFNSNGVEIQRGSSDINGIVVFKGLKYYSEYIIRELQAPENYLKVDKAEKIVIKEDGIKLNWDNMKIPEPKNPKTGDTIDYVFFGLSLICAVVLFVVLFMVLKKKDKKKDKKK